MLESYSTKTANGKKNYAILLLLARYGLRAHEIISLTLEDINWQGGEILIHGKGSKTCQLPLYKDVGEAIIKYIKNGRPDCSSRHLFLTGRKPYTEYASSSSIVQIVNTAFKKANIIPPKKGSHIFRHSLASSYLKNGASLFEIKEILRHQSIDTTSIYAKIDIEKLREIAFPWPANIPNHKRRAQ